MSLIDIDDYKGLYKFDKDLKQVLNVKTNKYIKNVLNGKNYCVYLYKDGKQKTFSLNYLINKYNNQVNQKDFVAIDNYENYKLNLKTNQILNIKSGKCIKKIINHGYYKVSLYKDNKRKLLFLHRLVYKAHNPLINIKELYIDHINQDKLDNNIDNLRLATHSQNNCNVKVYKNNKSTGIKNIGKTKNNTFQVQIMKDKKNHTKKFKTLEEAIEHRDLKLAELHGDFACYN